MLEKASRPRRLHEPREMVEEKISRRFRASAGVAVEAHHRKRVLYRFLVGLGFTTCFSCFFRRPGTVRPRRGHTRDSNQNQNQQNQQQNSISQGMNLKRLVSGDQRQSKGTHSGPLDLLSGRPRRGPDTYHCLGSRLALARTPTRRAVPPTPVFTVPDEGRRPASIRSRVRPPPMHPKSEPHIRGGAIRYKYLCTWY